MDILKALVCALPGRFGTTAPQSDSNFLIYGPRTDHSKDLSCAWPTLKVDCPYTIQNRVRLKTGAACVVDGFMNESEFEILNKIFDDPNYGYESEDVLNTSAWETPKWPRALYDVADTAVTMMRRIHGYATRHLESVSLHKVGPWAHTGEYYPDKMLFRRYNPGRKLSTHLDTGKFARCLSAVLFLGRRSIEGGVLRTHQCRKGSCTEYGWQHDDKFPAPMYFRRDQRGRFPEQKYLKLKAEVPYKAGRLVFFLAETPHDVTELLRGHRKVMFLWFSCIPTLSNGVTVNGHSAVIEYLISRRADVDASLGSKEGAVPLHEVTYVGDAGLADLLLNQRANVNTKMKSGDQPIHLASQKGYTVLLDLLMRHRANLNAKAHGGLTPMDIAKQNGHVALQRLLDMIKRETASAAEQSVLVTFSNLHPKKHVQILQLDPTSKMELQRGSILPQANISRKTISGSIWLMRANSNPNSPNGKLLKKVLVTNRAQQVYRVKQKSSEL